MQRLAAMSEIAQACKEAEESNCEYHQEVLTRRPSDMTEMMPSLYKLLKKMNGSFFVANCIKMAEPINVKKGQIGLANLGNTCYLNAVLQCLRHVSDLTLFFHKNSDDWIHKTDDKDAILCKAYKDLVQGLWNGTPEEKRPVFLRPAGFVHHFRNSLKGTAVEHMIAPLPHDSHEALVFLLDQLHEGMKRKLNYQVMAPPDSPVYGALTAWKDQVAPQYSPIIDYFFGLMEVRVQCSGCSNTSKRYELFNMLKVGFPDFKAASLEDCIEDDFKVETIDEYSCDHCKPVRKPATISRKIWRLPHNLIVVVRRFNMNGTKCHAQLKAEVDQTFTKWFSPESQETSKKATYAIQSIVDHHGSSNGGHYTAQVKSPFTGLWNNYDDENVHQIMDGSKPILGQSSYVLFYRRKSS